MATAWSVSPASSTRFAPTRSATRPQLILPPSEARPAALSTVAAAMAGTPWSIAWVTMWKIGPECAAQHAKYVKAMAANCGVRSACAAVSARPAVPADVSARRPSPPGGSRTNSAAGTMMSHASSPITSIAVRQSKVVMSQRASGAVVVEPSPSPAETSATARLRRCVNQRVVVAVIGAYRLPAAKPTITPK